MNCSNSNNPGLYFSDEDPDDDRDDDGDDEDYNDPFDYYDDDHRDLYFPWMSYIDWRDY